MNRDSNSYTFFFAAIMVIVVAGILSFTAISLKPTQDNNVKKEKMQNILSTVGITVERKDAEEAFKKYIVDQISLKKDGTVDENTDAFAIDLAKEVKKTDTDQRYPLYVAQLDGKKYYIIPLRGNGLWDAIWGYISLNDDLNTVKGAVFDHKGETPGLGAEITKAYFQQRFTDEKIFDKSGNFVGVSVVKGYNGGDNKDDNEVSAISGATITSRGVSNMIQERLAHYIPYFETVNPKIAEALKN
ncbi:NADH:ubiquinone reductase (Na(+)-transporting) subunit C [Zhouia sp. PK063]|uniref:NADH:ubiquinone reductase (Na(+)-transporting) subunit C n=1 Tax=Zhouia sp. PK063 TaxID=3373602 RepID=UPI0037A1B3F5